VILIFFSMILESRSDKTQTNTCALILSAIQV
jgi:hypothetical protein